MRKSLFFYVCLAFSLFLVTSVWAWPIPDSGQDKCYDDEGNEITCPSPGEPFYGQDANYSINPRSYTKLDAQGNALPDNATEWVMVKDNVTGLIWEVKTNDGGIHDKYDSYDWHNANATFIAKLNEQNFGGHSDWRVPTIKELASLVDLGTYDPAIDLDYFLNTKPATYWSSTTGSFGSAYAWRVYFDYGDDDFYGHKSYTNYVRAVRSGQSGSFDDLIINGDGTVTDPNTGLTWQQATAESSMTWSEALNYCENMNLAGHNDWRLPTRGELRSIVNYSKSDPAINEKVLHDTISSTYYWSSTTHSNYKDDSWLVHFNKGNERYQAKSNSYSVRAVRGGQLNILSFDDLKISQPSGTYPHKVILEATVSGGETPYSYHFDFGDGNTHETSSNQTEHTYTSPGEYQASCTVIDQNGTQAVSKPQTITILSQTPVSNAGAMKTVCSGDQVILDGSGSYDPEGSIQAYAWSQTSGQEISLNSTESKKVHFLAPDVSPSGSALTFELTVTDTNGQSNSSEVVVAVQDCSAPVITGVGNQTTPVSSQTWTWSATKPATYRYALDQRPTWTPTGDFSSVTSTSVSGGTGTWYLHVQAKDDLDNLSDVVTVYTVLQEAQTNSSLALRFAADEDAKPWYDPGDSLNLYANYMTEKGDTVDLADMVQFDVQTNWSSTDTSIATVEDGLVSFHANGKVRIIATGGGMSAEYELQVGQPDEDVQTKTYGNLIILAGGDPTDANDDLAPAIQYLSQRMYRIFTARGFHDEDIYFINHQTVDLDGDGLADGIVDEQEKTVANLEQAMSWADTQTNQGPLYVYLIDHGEKNGSFLVGDQEILTADQLDAMLNGFDPQR